MDIRRLVLNGLAVIALLVAITWFVSDLARQPETLSDGPILSLGIAAVLALLARIVGEMAERRALSEARESKAAQQTPFEADSGVFEVDQEETPDWLADVQPPEAQPPSSVPETPPPARPTIPVYRPAQRGGTSTKIIPAVEEDDSPDRAEESRKPERRSEDYRSAETMVNEPVELDWEDVFSRLETTEDLEADAEDSWEVDTGGGAQAEEEVAGDDDGGEDNVRGIPRMAEEAAPEAGAEPDEEPATGAEPEPLPEAGAEPAAGAIEFAAYYPPEVKPDDWQPLKAYIFKEEAYLVVVADSQAQFGPREDIRETVAAALQPVAEDALVTAIPDVPGLEFDPPQASARFRKDWRRFDFEFRAVDAPLDESADGRITFFVEGVIVADVKISVYVSRRAGRRIAAPQRATAKPYQAVFCSYSHKDTLVVERVERSSRMHFTKFLRDVRTLRSGERWNDRLLEMIDEADIFQLFWSKPASDSPYVKQEWQYALALRETGAKDRYFIRPVRWEEPMSAPPPAELSDLHFDLIEELAGE